LIKILAIRWAAEMIDFFREELQLGCKLVKGDSLVVLADSVNDLGTRLDDLDRRCRNPEDCNELDA
jgi:hypothetical protein